MTPGKTLIERKNEAKHLMDSLFHAEMKKYPGERTKLKNKLRRIKTRIDHLSAEDWQQAESILLKLDKIVQNSHSWWHGFQEFFRQMKCRDNSYETLRNTLLFSLAFITLFSSLFPRQFCLLLLAYAESEGSSESTLQHIEQECEMINSRSLSENSLFLVNVMLLGVGLIGSLVTYPFLAKKESSILLNNSFFLTLPHPNHAMTSPNNSPKANLFTNEP
ncbi:hypothetical protein [Legionella waltersii]|uniref:Uncharacterized protein n=1 Tax=Legionella waltersii TaxID=66969 RepID=A0A0W1A5H1_9GAMM|nr:hypothetical protein [Legionella waltersii]KTD76587.1 hypothetical protein Lwal_2309 [Legionella waltersii]SNU94474.1 Uncharacterised protein [Legionella waltersii]